MPRLRRLWVASLLVLATTGCGQVEPVLVTVSMPDCAHTGATTMDVGELRVILTLNGLGSAGLMLVELGDERGYQDLVDELENRSGDGSVPPWVTEVVSLQIEDGTGVDSVAETVDIEGGQYALVCLYRSPDVSETMIEPAAPLVVGSP
jgi:hypothetical protein